MWRDFLYITNNRLGFPLSRLKTGTPPRLHRDSINWSILPSQPSDMPPPPFSYLNSTVKHIDQLIDCAQTATNSSTHELVMKYQHELPDYEGGDGDGVGPRYCPSIFKKVAFLVHSKYILPFVFCRFNDFVIGSNTMFGLNLRV